jgi:iron complex outermembrane receptor protein
MVKHKIADGIIKKPKSRSLGLASGITVVLCVQLITQTSAVAQTEPAGQSNIIRQVFVTARIRQEDLQDTPVSVSVFEGERLEERAIRSFEELSYSIPNFTVSESPVDTNIFIRGIGSPENQGFEQSVGFFSDGLYWGRSRQARSPFFDVERIEVIKGPQGILFGKNTSAGAVNITTRNPTEETEAAVSVYYEPDAKERVTEASLSGQISDTIKARIAIRSASMEGWVQNTATGSNEPDRDELVARGTLLFEPSDELELILKYETGSFDVTGSSMQITDTGPLFGPLFSLFDSSFEAELDDSRSVGGGDLFLEPEKNDTSTDIASLTLNWDLAEHQLSFISGYSAYEFDDVFDADISSLQQAQKLSSSDFEQRSYELRLISPAASAGGWDYIVGLYRQESEFNLDTRDDINLAALQAPAGSRYSRTDQSSDIWGAFGQASWHFSDALRLTAGLRWVSEEKDARRTLVVTSLGTTTANTGLEPFFAGALGTFPHDLVGSRSEEQWLPSLGLEWDANDNSLLYVSYSRGFKGGGFDEQFYSGVLADWEFEDEEADAFEAGIKLSLPEINATLNMALFHTNYTDLQVSAFNGIAGFVVGNAAEATTQGLEIDGRIRWGSRLFAGASAAYLDAEYDSFEDAGCTAAQQGAQMASGSLLPCSQSLSGKEPLFSPDWTGNIYLEYVYPMQGSGFELRILGQVNYSDEVFVSQDLDPNLLQKSYAKLDIRAVLAAPGEAWEIALVGKNLTDKQTTSFGNDVPILAGAYFKFADRPRTIAVQAMFRF